MKRGYVDWAKQGKKVSLITQRWLGRDVQGSIFVTLRQMLVDNGVSIYTDATAFEILEDGLYVAQYKSLFFLKADTIVLAVGTRAENGLATALESAGHNVRLVGDCVDPRDALDAIYEGHKAGFEL